MSIQVNLVDTLLQAARAQGLDQRQLAERAGLRPETVSRAKRRGTLDLSSLQALAGVVGLELALRPGQRYDTTPPNPSVNPPPVARSPLAEPQWGLAWSNPDAPAEALVRNALAHGRFDLLLQAVIGHGLGTVLAQWQQVAPTLPARARREVQRKLDNIEKGWRDAAS